MGRGMSRSHDSLQKIGHSSSIVDPNTLNLDLDPGFWLNLDPDPGPDPDPGLYYQF